MSIPFALFALTILSKGKKIRNEALWKNSSMIYKHERFVLSEININRQLFKNVSFL